MKWNRHKLHYEQRERDVVGAGPRRYFLRFFRWRRSAVPPGRPGAMSPARLKAEINRIGTGKVVELMRIGFDGQLDDMPVIVEITQITNEGFSGKIVNVERNIIEENSDSVVYAKRGGGIIEFRFDDGDIKEVNESKDAEELSEAQDTEAMLEILSALEINDRILVAYFEKKHGGAVNVEGVLLSRAADRKSFSMRIDKINNVELDNKVEREFQIGRDLVIDISIQ